MKLIFLITICLTGAIPIGRCGHARTTSRPTQGGGGGIQIGCPVDGAGNPLPCSNQTPRPTLRNKIDIP